MFNFNVGDRRPASDEAPLEPYAAANDLVRRTLAQHGLMAGSTLPSSNPWSGNPASKSGAVAQAARVQENQFSCDAGSRIYRTYAPVSATRGVTGLVVMLHGCTQTSEDFAAATAMNALAEQHRFVVVYPQQSRGDNAQSCWNWFSRGDQQRDRGEPAILAGLTRQVMAEHEIPGDQVFVAGLSAGAAMAVILGETYGDIFSGVGAHSGLPFGAANDVQSAFAAMAGNGQENPRPAQDASIMRTIIFHGSADATVHPSNSDRIWRQAADRGPRQTIETSRSGRTSGRSFSRRTTVAADGTIVLEHWTVNGLGHAWSGGQPGGSYTDHQGPDASAEMVRFFFQHDMEQAL